MNISNYYVCNNRVEKKKQSRVHSVMFPCVDFGKISGTLICWQGPKIVFSKINIPILVRIQDVYSTGPILVRIQYVYSTD